MSCGCDQGGFCGCDQSANIACTWLQPYVYKQASTASWSRLWLVHGIVIVGDVFVGETVSRGTLDPLSTA